MACISQAGIYTIHKESKPQKVIAGGPNCSQSAVTIHINEKLSGRKSKLSVGMSGRKPLQELGSWTAAAFS